MHRIASAAIVATTLMMSSVASAASIDEIQGVVLVNQGQGFKRLAGPVGVPPGVRVMANPGGSATIFYDNGCREPVEPGVIVTVKSEGACRVGPVDHFVLGAIGVGGVAALAIGRRGGNDRPASP
jgi:hypothetical protein